jgi:hypothetical protein
LAQASSSNVQRAAVWFALLLEALVWILQFQLHCWLSTGPTASLQLQSKKKKKMTVQPALVRFIARMTPV